jgi:hypothetical protein
LTSATPIFSNPDRYLDLDFDEAGCLSSDRELRANQATTQAQV